MDATLVATYMSAGALVLNALGFTATAAITFLTWRNIRLLTNQIHSEAQGRIFEAHKDLYLEILAHEHLTEIVAEGNTAKYRRDMLGSLLINHCARIYADYTAKIHRAGPAFDDEFVRDAVDLFALPLVRNRWPSVKDYHSQNFRGFIDERVFGDIRHKDYRSNVKP